MLRRAPTFALALAVALAACGGDDDSSDARGDGGPGGDTTTAAATTTTLPPDPLPPVAQLEGANFAAQEVFSVDSPTGMAFRDGDSALYVIGKGGRVWRVVDNVVQPDLTLDLTGRVSDGSERGLLGIAFSPVDGRMFLDFTDVDGHTRVVSWTVGDDGTADPDSEREVLFQEQPGPGHNGGGLAFDAAGNLYVALGDGGGSKGRDAQDPTKILGSIVRIAPKADGPGYDIPEDNPFAGSTDMRPERLVVGLRNPWRFSLDPPTGDIWLGDVGSDAVEEVDRITPADWGRNYGWYFMEGSRVNVEGAPPDLVPPVHEYGHDAGIAIIGGYVYRGAAIPALRGAFLFGDMGGPLWMLGSEGVVRARFNVEPPFSSFGLGPDGELYVISLKGPVSKLVPA